MSRQGIIIGASAGVGRAIAHQLAAAGWDLVISARGQADLDQLAEELRSAGGTITPIAMDVAAPHAQLRAFLSAASSAMPSPDAVIITAGSVAGIDEALDDWATTDQLIAANMAGVMKLAGHFVVGIEQRNRGTLVLFSSIAAGAPRRNNVAYAAAKAGLESFAASMQHRLGRSDAAVQLYRLGYVDTRLAQDQDLKLKPTDPKEVAARVIARLGGRSRTVYEPRYWSVIVRGLRMLPSPIYNRLDF